MLAVPGAWLQLEEDGVPAAAMSAVADGAQVGLFDLAVRPEFRRRGLAQRIIGAAGHWAAGLGADVAWAQVAAANAPSLALNAGLGLREVYRYRYWLRDSG
jgi:GNAT superfamily N-acetyltransferase